MRIWIAVAGWVMGALPGMAEPVLVTDIHVSGPRVVRIDTASLAVEAVSTLEGYSWDAAVGSDGFLYTGGFTAIPRCDQSGALIDRLVDATDVDDLAFRADGTIVALDRAYAHSAESGIAEYGLDGSMRWSDTIPGFALMGMDVPRAGPFENGIIAIAIEDASGLYHLFRWSHDPASGWLREGPFGPLELDTFPACNGTRSCAWHPTAATDGLSFYTLQYEPPWIQQFDMEGTWLRTFAIVAPDLGALASGVPGSWEDSPSNILPLDDGSVLVTTWRRLHRYDALGNRVATAPHIFGSASAVTLARPLTFESAGIACRPWSMGFWKRQCASQGLRMAPRRSFRGVPSAPPIHPRFEDGRLPGVVERANRWMEPHGLTACSALQPDEPSTWSGKALRRYAAIALNWEDRRQGRRCPVIVEGATRQAGDVLDELRMLLASDEDEDLRRAFHLAGRLLGEE